MSVQLGGIDGRNPVGFLAALGALTLATESLGESLTLAWARPTGVWHPMLDRNASLDPETVVEAIVAAHEGRDLALELEWDSDVMKLTRDDVRVLLRDRLDDAGFRPAAMVGACVGELPPRGRGGSLAPYSPFRLIPRMGRARFLATARALSEARDTSAAVRHALFDKWRYTKCNSLRWDPGATVPARAYSAEAPTHFGPLGVPGAMLLAVAGLAFFPLMLSHGRPACRGFGRSQENLMWPIWEQRLDERATRLLLGLPAMYQEVPDARLLRRHGVAVRMVATREQLAGDDEMLSWGEPRVLSEAV